ncbi:MAG TPA: hypothetical protein VFT22_07935 [Kofleriaceae bacterium]|nr:hypothetical protein [Kofleriaceae bacterium]
MTLTLLLVSMATACATDPSTDPSDPSATVDVSTRNIRVNPDTDLLEPAFVNGAFCQIDFIGGLTSKTEVYQIWAVGTHGIVDNATYNTPRPNFYAVFGTSAAGDVTHHVDGFDQFDHYHVIENAHGGTDVDNTIWDLFAVFPGPNYDAATYQPAKSVSQMNQQIAAGILGPVLTLQQAGFPPVVLYFPVICPQH